MFFSKKRKKDRERQRVEQATAGPGELRVLSRRVSSPQVPGAAAPGAANGTPVVSSDSPPNL